MIASAKTQRRAHAEALSGRLDGLSPVLRVRFAKWDPRYLFVFDERNQLLCTAEAAQAFAFLGEDGARTQAQRAQQLKRHLRDLRANTKRLDLTRMRRIDEGLAYVLQPLFGPVERATAKRFRQVSQGYWRDSLELARACQRLMAQLGTTQLNLEVVEAAAQWMAEGRRETASFVPQ